MQQVATPAGHLAAHGRDPRREALPQARCPHPGPGGVARRSAGPHRPPLSRRAQREPLRADACRAGCRRMAGIARSEERRLSRPRPHRGRPRDVRRRRLGVVVVDPLPVVRAGLALLIEDRPDMEVLAEAGTADEGSRRSSRVRRSRVVVLVGLGLAGEHDAFWLIRTLRERFPSHAILGVRRQRRPDDDLAGPVHGRRRLRGQEHRPRRVPAVAPPRRRPRDGAGGPGARGRVGQIAEGIERRRDMECGSPSASARSWSWRPRG